MNTSGLKLNDFESFENFLFTEEEQRGKLENEKWAKYIIDCELGGPVFVSPIINPQAIEEFQLCHYVYWMCIAIFKPWEKMNFYFKQTKPHGSCYACGYTHRLNPNLRYFCDNCPLKDHFLDPTHGCISPFLSWRNKNNTDMYGDAIKIATWPWVKPNISRLI